MSPKIQEFVKGKGPGDGSVDAFLEGNTFPIVEGNRITFVWKGEADHVRLRHWIYWLPSIPSYHRIPGTDLWYLVLELPKESRIEYKVEVERGGHRELLRDPLNPHLAYDPYGANSVLRGEGYKAPDWTEPDPEARPGVLEEHEIDSRAFGEVRPVTVYLPARMRVTRRYPLLVVHDGADYLRFAGMKTVLDNLIHRLELPSMIVAFTQSPARMREYMADPAHAAFLVEDMIPVLESMLPIARDPSTRGLVGASLGAVASLHAAWTYPSAFGRLLLQSGSWAFSDIGETRRGPRFDTVFQFINSFRETPTRVAEKIYVSCGVYEGLIYENRSLSPSFQASCADYRYLEVRDGHNWENWRDRLREGLSWLLPGPLWMVYE